MSERTFNTLRLTLFSLLLVWGMYTLIAYMSVPVHQIVLLENSQREAIIQSCGSQDSLCTGVQAILPLISRGLSYLSPFTWYIILSFVLGAILLLVEYMRSGDVRMRITLSPLRVIFGFVLSLWMIFTVISLGTTDGAPYTRLYEPLQQVYVSALPEGLAALQKNAEELTARNCLAETDQTTANGARIYNFKHRCVQMSFVTRVMPPAFLVLFLLFVFLSFGRGLMQLLRVPTRQPISEAMFSVGLGACAVIVLLWLLAIIGFYTQAAGWILLLAIPAIFFKQSWYWLQALVQRRWTYAGAWHAGAPVFFWLLVSLLALNYLNVIRPFPIGWDDLGKYINQPRLLVSYGEFIPQLATFLWEYITSLGFLLFGYESVFGATLAMILNWMAGLLAVLAIFVFGRIYLGPMQGLLAALLYYAMPVVGHFSFADMKVDNAVFFMGALSTLAIFLALFPAADEESDDETADIHAPWSYRWIILAGIFGGFAFAMKPTAIMVLMALGAVLFGAVVHWVAFAGAFSLVWAIYVFQKRLDVSDLFSRIVGQAVAVDRLITVGILLIIGLVCMGYATMRNTVAMRRAAIAAAIFIGSFLASIAPWIVYNNASYGRLTPHLTFTARNTITPTFVIDNATPVPKDVQNVRVLPDELKVDPLKCQSTAKEEELDRYWGTREGISHYLSLPWRVVMNSDSAGYYLTMYPALLLFPLLLLVPFFWMRQGRWLRWLFTGTLFMLLQWVFFANGVPWYGLGVFMGLVLGLEALVYRTPDTAGKITASVMVCLSLVIAFSNRMWQFEQQRNLFEYSIGKVSAEAIQERTIPHYDDIRETVEQRIKDMPDRPYVYRMGTFIPYFIPRNLEVLPLADNQLDFFNCLYQERDPQLLIRRLQALGFNSMIFDTNTHTIERDPNGSLHQKVNTFVDFVNTPGLGLDIEIQDTDAGVAFILLP